MGYIGMPLASEPAHINADAFLGAPPLSSSPKSSQYRDQAQSPAIVSGNSTIAATIPIEAVGQIDADDADDDDRGEDEVWGSTQGKDHTIAMTGNPATTTSQQDVWGNAVPGVVHLNAGIPLMLSPRTSLWGLNESGQNMTSSQILPPVAANKDRQPQRQRGRSRQPKPSSSKQQQSKMPTSNEQRAPEIDNGLWTWTAEKRRLGVGPSLGKVNDVEDLIEGGQAAARRQKQKNGETLESVRDIWNRPAGEPQQPFEQPWTSLDSSTDDGEGWQPNQENGKPEEREFPAEDGTQESRNEPLFEQGPRSHSRTPSQSRMVRPHSQQHYLRLPEAYVDALHEDRLVHIEPIPPEFPADSLLSLLRQYGDVEWQHQIREDCRAIVFPRPVQAQYACRGLNKAKMRGLNLQVYIPSPNRNSQEERAFDRKSSVSSLPSSSANSNQDQSPPRRAASRTYSWRLNESAYRSSPERPPTTRGRLHSRETEQGSVGMCYNWNLGECLHAECPLRHVCLRCRQPSHVIRHCPHTFQQNMY